MSLPPSNSSSPDAVSPPFFSEEVGLDALPAKPIEREVWVRSALSHRTEPRGVVQACEWMVEPLVGEAGVALTLVLSDKVSLSFALSADDAQDLAHVLKERAGG